MAHIGWGWGWGAGSWGSGSLCSRKWWRAVDSGSNAGAARQQPQQAVGYPSTRIARPRPGCRRRCLSFWPPPRMLLTLIAMLLGDGQPRAAALSVDYACVHWLRSDETGLILTSRAQQGDRSRARLRAEATVPSQCRLSCAREFSGEDPAAAAATSTASPCGRGGPLR